MLDTINQPVIEPVAESELAAHLRLSTAAGGVIVAEISLSDLLRDAVRAIEARTRRTLLSRGLRWRMSRWPEDCGSVHAPTAPTGEILAVRRYRADGSPEDLGADAVRFRPGPTVATLRGASGRLPALPTGGWIEIDFEAGYGGWADLPPDLRRACLIMAAHFYEHRHATADRIAETPFGVAALVAPYALLRI